MKLTKKDIDLVIDRVKMAGDIAWLSTIGLSERDRVGAVVALVVSELDHNGLLQGELPDMWEGLPMKRVIK